MAQWRDRPITLSLSLSLRQRNALAVVAQHVEDLHPIRGNPDYFIPSIHDVALCRNKNVFILNEKNSFRSIRPAGCKSIKFEIARRRRWWWRRSVVSHDLVVQNWTLHHLWWRLHKHPKNIPPRAFVFRFFALATHRNHLRGRQGARFIRLQPFSHLLQRGRLCEFCAEPGKGFTIPIP